jgi:transposase
MRLASTGPRNAGGAWRTLAASPTSRSSGPYLSTAAKWDISKPGALRRLFTTGPWLPPAVTPP